MKTIFVTDFTTQLSKALFTQYDFYLIENKKSPLGQITYALDKLANAEFEIVYITTTKSYKIINEIAKKINNIHPLCKFCIIDSESVNIGKNNFALKLLNNDLQTMIEKYQPNYNVIYDEAYQKALGATKSLLK